MAPAMTLALSAPPCPDSVIRRLDVRWKLAGVLLVILVTACLRHVAPSLAALGFAVFLAAMSRLPSRWYFARVGATLLLLSPFLVSLPLLLHDRGTVSTLGVVTFPYGLGMALLLGAKALSVLTLVLVLLATAPLDATLKAGHALRLPGLLVQLGLLAYRYLFVIAAELRRLRVALRVRGFHNQATRHGYRTVGHVAGTLLVRSLERSERVGQAMHCRGFDGQFRSLTQFHAQPRDVLAFVMMAVWATGLLWWDLLCP
jgi:cobalt/nickel transport system permease protein